MARDVDKRLETPVDAGKFREIEDELAKLADSGALDAFPESAVPLPPSREDRLLRAIRAHDDLRSRLRAAHTTLKVRDRSFERLVRDLRELAGVTLEEVAQAAHLRPSELAEIEDGTADLLDLAPETIVGLMEVFSIRIGLLEMSIGRSLAARKTRATLSTPVARTTNAEPSDLERVMQDMAEFFADESDAASSPAVLPTGYTDRVRATLRRWGRTDLL